MTAERIVDGVGKICHPLHIRIYEERCEDRRESQKGLGEDKRDHTCHVDHEGQIAAYRHGHAVANTPSGEEHGDEPPALLNNDDREDRKDQQRDNQDE